MNVNEALVLFELNKDEFYIKSPDCKRNIIKKIYRKKMLEIHPDKNQGVVVPTELISSWNDAYKILISEYEEQVLSAKDILFNILTDYTTTGDAEIDNFVACYGYKLYNFFNKS